MDPLMEKELELAAKRQGISKSQFIIDAVERALGRKNPAALYHTVMEAAARYDIGDGARDEDLPRTKAAVRDSLRERYEEQQGEYAAHLAQRKAAHKGRSS